MGSKENIRHSDLQGLDDDDHDQYLTWERTKYWHDLIPGKHVSKGDNHTHVNGDGAKIKHSDLLGAGKISHEEIDQKLKIVDDKAIGFNKNIEKISSDIKRITGETLKRTPHDFLDFPLKLQPIVEDVLVIEDAWEGWKKKSVAVGTLPFAPQDHSHVISGGVTDHGALTGLGDDDHTQYLTEARHDSLPGDHVTGGDAHDHAGGDGAQIDHGGLAGVGDDDHMQYHTDLRAGIWHAGLTGEHVTGGNAHDHNGGDGAAIAEGAMSLSDVITLDLSTARHGFAPKAPGGTTQFLRSDASWAVPPSGGGTPGDTVVSETAFGQSPAAGSQTDYSRKDHTHGTPTDPVPAHSGLSSGVHGVGAGTVAKVADIVATKLDDFTLPDDNIDLDVSITRHGLFPKLPGGTTNFFREDGSWQPAGGGSGLTHPQVMARVSMRM